MKKEDVLSNIEEMSVEIQSDKVRSYHFFERSKSYLLSGEYEKALEDINMAIQKSEANESYYLYNYYVQRGRIYYATCEFGKAFEDFHYAIQSESIETGKNSPYGSNMRGPVSGSSMTWRDRANEMNEKQKSSKSLISVSDEIGKLILWAQNDSGFDGDQYVMRYKDIYGWKNRTIEDFSKKIDSWEKRPVLFYYRGLLYAEINEYDKAIDDFNEYIKTTGLSPETKSIYALGLIYFEKKLYPTALEYFDDAISMYFIEQEPHILLWRNLTQKMISNRNQNV
jgi:tetratricopeptide (TPR) repeat protein